MTVIYYPGYSQVQVQYVYLCQQIASITQSNPCVITTENDHGYNPGLNVTFQIQSMFGMTNLNGISAEIVATTSNTFTINVDSTNFSPFAYPNPLPSAYTPPQAIPNASGYPLPPLPLPYGNQNTFVGSQFNNGAIGDPIV